MWLRQPGSRACGASRLLPARRPRRRPRPPAPSPRCRCGRDSESVALACLPRSFPLRGGGGGLATSAGRLGWRPCSPGSAQHPRLRLASSAPGSRATSREGGLLLGQGAGGDKNEERSRDGGRGKPLATPSHLGPAQQVIHPPGLGDAAPVRSPRGPGSCPGSPDPHLTPGPGSRLEALHPQLPSSSAPADLCGRR